MPIVAVHRIRVTAKLNWCCFHWRQPRRGCRGHIPPNILVGGGTSTGISPPILLRTFGYSRPILVPSVRSASSRFHSAIRRHQFASVSQADSRLTRLIPPNLELALTPLTISTVCRTKWKRQAEECLALIADSGNVTTALQHRLGLRVDLSCYKPLACLYLPPDSASFSSSTLPVLPHHNNYDHLLRSRLERQHELCTSLL